MKNLVVSELLLTFAALYQAPLFRAFCKTKGFTIGKLNLYVPMLSPNNIGIFVSNPFQCLQDWKGF